MTIPFLQTSTFTGLVSTLDYGTSEFWHGASTIVQSYSAIWNSDDIQTIEDVLDFLSSDAVNIFQLNVTTNAAIGRLHTIFGQGSICIGENCKTLEDYSHAEGYEAVAVNEGSYIWSDGDGFTNSISTTNDFQYMISASGGVFIPGQATIGELSANNLTVYGNLTAFGTTTFVSTTNTESSALSVINYGPGPALYVYQGVNTGNIASFINETGTKGLHIGVTGKVGINEDFPNKELTVNGEISATGIATLSAINLQTVPANSVIFTGETTTATSSVTATDAYIKVIVNGENKYIRLFDVI